MKRDDRYVFRPEYRWPKDQKTKPFYTVPAWWRRFIFQVLKPRELMVYHYYLAVADTNGSAWPSAEQIASDMGYGDIDAVRKAVRRLVSLGFLMAPTTEERTVLKVGKMPLYQRPCPQYTIKTLLAARAIDGDLYSTDNQVRSEYGKLGNSLVRSGISVMLEGQPDLRAAYEQTADDDTEQGLRRRTEVLEACLDEVLRSMADAVPKPERPKARKMEADVISRLPETVRTALGITPGRIVGLRGALRAGAAPKKKTKATRRRKRRSD